MTSVLGDVLGGVLGDCWAAARRAAARETTKVALARISASGGGGGGGAYLDSAPAQREPEDAREREVDPIAGDVVLRIKRVEVVLLLVAEEDGKQEEDAEEVVHQHHACGRVRGSAAQRPRCVDG